MNAAKFDENQIMNEEEFANANQKSRTSVEVNHEVDGMPMNFWRSEPEGTGGKISRK